MPYNHKVNYKLLRVKSEANSWSLDQFGCNKEMMKVKLVSDSARAQEILFEAFLTIQNACVLIHASSRSTGKIPLRSHLPPSITSVRERKWSPGVYCYCCIQTASYFTVLYLYFFFYLNLYSHPVCPFSAYYHFKTAQSNLFCLTINHEKVFIWILKLLSFQIEKNKLLKLLGIVLYFYNLNSQAAIINYSP